MQMNTFNFDAQNASISKQDSRTLTNGNEIIRVKFDTGLTMIYTKTPTGLENIDFSHELVKDINGNYQADMQHEKQDFNDYFEI
ncbi:hypothetical protein QFC96_09825 [Latilactobacillus curvatus]|uniref:Uncharacterized protein n=2 Tax=Latilactobacillus curvatus TaxID=28038 RepID=A0AAJ5USQ6_LATCU|nr:hypothetical protein [Latilactobacillus curvatus]MCS8616995.1 hypothetical protein [Latilactobacillus curvatus]WDC92860.1 hypothetical protein PSR33_09885 [Latilactobacillus curvatus]WHQ78115.1 hypothetical protein QFC96_09825 [Latilactobacillus curvatus]BCX31461.1 hypothetical protein LTWDN19_20280 [Latilactobacillus curvatus]